MKAIKTYPYTVLHCAMLFSVYTFVRPGEVRAAEWSEFKEESCRVHARMNKDHAVVC